MDYGRLVQAAVRQMPDMPGHNMPGHNMPAAGAGAAATDAAAKGAGGMAHGGMHMMTPYLFGDKRDFFVLFREARVTSAGGLAAAIVASLVFAVLSTAFSNYSKMLERRAAGHKRRINPLLFVSTVSFALRIGLHYVAMLIVMTMNVYLIIAVVAGHGIGYFLFAALLEPKIEQGCEEC